MSPCLQGEREKWNTNVLRFFFLMLIKWAGLPSLLFFVTNYLIFLVMKGNWFCCRSCAAEDFVEILNVDLVGSFEVHTILATEELKTSNPLGLLVNQLQEISTKISSPTLLHEWSKVCGKVDGVNETSPLPTDDQRKVWTRGAPHCCLLWGLWLPRLALRSSEIPADWTEPIWNSHSII